MEQPKYSRFQRNQKSFNSTDYMRKSKTILNSIKSPETITRQNTALTSRHKPSISIPEFFITDLLDSSPTKSTKTQKFSILSEFGLLPERNLPLVYEKKLSDTCRSKIKIPDLLGKKNRQQLFKSLDLNSEISKKEKKIKSFESHPTLTSKFQFAINGKLKDICRTTGVLNGYKNIDKYSEKLGKIDHIYKSCDNLLKESKHATKTLEFYTKDLKY